MPKQRKLSRPRIRRKILPADDGDYTRQWLDDGFPPPPREHNEFQSRDQSPDPESFTQSVCVEENRVPTPNRLCNQRSCSVESVNSNKSAGYDFEPFANGAGLSTWSPRLNSRSSFTSSLPSDSDEDELGWVSSSEVSLEDRNSLKSGSVSCYHGNTRPAPAVWCIDCQEDLLVAGCSDGTVEV